MLLQICNQTSNAILRALVQQIDLENGAICKPSAYFATRHRLISSVLKIVVKHNLNNYHNNSLEEVFESLENKLVSDGIFTQSFNNITVTEKQALEAFHIWFQSQNFDRVALSDLYELMLLLEFPVRDGAITEENENWNSVGSFYTPANLADKLVELTIDNYIFQHTGLDRFSSSESNEVELKQVKELLKHSSFADYSCGTGSFFLAIIRYLEKRLHLSKQELKEVVLNFYAIEADYLSLEIAKIQILEAVNGFDLYPELSKRFINGNPLIAPNDEAESFEYCDGFYYHNDLALQPNHIRKCDVIIGNPPWGTVGFDLNYYLHILCPRLADIDNEQELDTALEILSETHPKLYDWLLIHDKAVDTAMENMYNDDRFQHSNMGGLQTNVLFTELCDSLCTERGSVGLVLKSATLSDSVNKRLWNHLTATNKVIARYDFINCNKIFNIKRTEEFSLLILSNQIGTDHMHRTGLTHLYEIE